MILVVTNKDDTHTDAVIEHFHRMNASFLRLNTEDFPKKVDLTLKSDRAVGYGRQLETPAATVDLDNVRSVWYRRPEDPLISESVDDPAVRDLALSESQKTLTWLWGLLKDRFWVNPPNRNRVASNKLVQEEVAGRFGIRTPDYLLTNDPNDAREFAECYSEIVVKPIGSGLIERGDGYRLIYTNRLSPADIRKLELVRYAPTYLQEHIRKAYELRITVVGSDVFACRINSQDSERTRDDWRRYDHENVAHISYDLPDRIEEFTRQIVSEFGLRFGAIDMVVTPDDNYVFLEINPNGQWLWTERLAGLPISSSLARMLLRGEEEEG